MNESVTLRATQPEDQDFLLAVYASTRADELAGTDWTEKQKAQFCEMQFTAQTSHYLLHYPTAEYFIAEYRSQPAGRLYVDRWEKEIRIMDIAIMPAFRNLGIGTKLLRQLQQEAESSNRLLSIHVERMNPALRLYERLGFTLTEDKGIYLLMGWQPPLAPLEKK